MATPTIDVIVPVYGSLHVVRPCVDSVVAASDGLRRLVLVDDGSDAHTAAELDAMASQDGVEVLRNPRNLGFVHSCNRALAQSDADLVVLLNSDTAVPPRWLEKVRACFASDARIGVASPVSNFAPHNRVDPVPGLDFLQMAALVEALSDRSYPDITTPEGFCYVISRACLDVLDSFDPLFDRGYGEESDFALRANYEGFRTVCIDDLYVYHRGRGTFGQAVRDELYNRNKVIFHDRWSNRYAVDFQDFQARDPLGGLRSRLAAATPPGYQRVFLT